MTKGWNSVSWRGVCPKTYGSMLRMSLFIRVAPKMGIFICANIQILLNTNICLKLIVCFQYDTGRLLALQGPFKLHALGIVLACTDIH